MIRNSITVMCLVFSFVFSQLYGGVIALLVFPDIKQVHTVDDREYNFFKVQIQFFKLNQVCLVSTKDRPGFDYGTITTTGETPEAWQQLLESGTETVYQLGWHKRFKNLSEDDELKIFIHQGNGQFQNSLLSPEILKKILTFMTRDQQSDQSCCYEFIKAIKFNFIEGRGSNNEHYNLYSFIEYHDEESKFLPGDAIVCYYRDDKVCRLKHWALAIGDGMYFAKDGYAGMLSMSTMKVMLAFWGCNHYGKLKQEALENRYLWDAYKI